MSKRSFSSPNLNPLLSILSLHSLCLLDPSDGHVTVKVNTNTSTRGKHQRSTSGCNMGGGGGGGGVEGREEGGG